MSFRLCALLAAVIASPAHAAPPLAGKTLIADLTIQWKVCAAGKCSSENSVLNVHTYFAKSGSVFTYQKESGGIVYRLNVWKKVNGSENRWTVIQNYTAFHMRGGLYDLYVLVSQPGERCRVEMKHDIKRPDVTVEIDFQVRTCRTVDGHQKPGENMR